MEKHLKDFVRDYYFQKNYNCAEAMIHAGNDFYSLSLDEHAMKMVSGYGAGLQSGSTCGALVCGISIISLLLVQTNAHDCKLLPVVANQFTKKFQEKYHSTLCREVRPQSFVPSLRCLNTIDSACDALEEVLSGYVSQEL